MNNFKLPNLLIGIVMLASAGLTVAITPTRHVADQGPKINLETMIPKKFGDWTVDEKMVYQQVSPDLKAELAKIYTVVLERTYVNSQGYRIMLSVPYGADQSDGLSAHDPESCYPAQGFQINAKSKDILRTSSGDIPVRRIETSNGSRHEPVTYWFTVGNYAANTDWERKKGQMRYAIKGEIPDGLLFRVSSIDQQAQNAYQTQQSFVNDLLKVLPPDDRLRLAGIAPAEVSASYINR